MQELYHRLFSQILLRINTSLGFNEEKQDQEASCLKFGIVDVFGFENHEVNSWEQFKINYIK
jgi:myosin heavy subunit